MKKVILFLLLSGCAGSLSDYEKIFDAVEVGSVAEDDASDIAVPVDTVQESEQEEEQEPEAKKEENADNEPGKKKPILVTGHDYTCTVGDSNRGGAALVFDGRRGGFEVLDSKYGDELKVGFPWDYSNKLVKNLELCGPRKCISAQNERTEWVNWDATPQGKRCRQFVRFGLGNGAQKLFREVGGTGKYSLRGTYLNIDQHTVNLCSAKMWKKNKRCT